jgi:Zn ribbon nucleic-acid-binding protein
MKRDEAIKAVEAYDGKDYLAVVVNGDEFSLHTAVADSPANDIAVCLVDGNEDLGFVAGKTFLVSSPDFDAEAFDKLDWTKIKALLEAAEPEPLDEDPDQVQRTVYLGSILNLSPSGKVYYPFASSNVTRCPFCHGNGNVDNPFMDKALYQRAKEERAALLAANAVDGKGFMDWPLESKVKANELDRISSWAEDTIGCPHCHSVGAREAYEDEEYRNHIEGKAEELGAFITGSEGDGCDILIAKVEPAPDKDDDG